MISETKMLVKIFEKKNSLQVHTISGANITSPDNTATNGVVHVIDRMLYRFPEVYTTQYVHEHQNLSKISLLIDKGGLHDQLKGIYLSV